MNRLDRIEMLTSLKGINDHLRKRAKDHENEIQFLEKQIDEIEHKLVSIERQIELNDEILEAFEEYEKGILTDEEALN